MCLFFMKWGKKLIVLERSGLIWVLQQCYTTAFKMHKSVYSCSFAGDAWHVHWRRANFWDTFICSALFVVKPLYVMTETCPLWLISLKGDDGWGQWFPGRSVSSVFHLAGWEGMKLSFSFAPLLPLLLHTSLVWSNQMQVLESVFCDSKMQDIGPILHSCPWITDHLFISNE